MFHVEHQRHSVPRNRASPAGDGNLRVSVREPAMRGREPHETIRSNPLPNSIRRSAVLRPGFESPEASGGAVSSCVFNRTQQDRKEEQARLIPMFHVEH